MDTEISITSNHCDVRIVEHGLRGTNAYPRRDLPSSPLCSDRTAKFHKHIPTPVRMRYLFGSFRQQSTLPKLTEIRTYEL